MLPTKGIITSIMPKMDPLTKELLKEKGFRRMTSDDGYKLK